MKSFFPVKLFIQPSGTHILEALYITVHVLCQSQKEWHAFFTKHAFNSMQEGCVITH